MNRCPKCNGMVNRHHIYEFGIGIEGQRISTCTYCKLKWSEIWKLDTWKFEGDSSDKSYSANERPASWPRRIRASGR